MQLHPAVVATLMAERERTLRRRAQRARNAPRTRQARRAPWIP